MRKSSMLIIPVLALSLSGCGSNLFPVMTNAHNVYRGTDPVTPQEGHGAHGAHGEGHESGHSGHANSDDYNTFGWDSDKGTQIYADQILRSNPVRKDVEAPMAEADSDHETHGHGEHDDSATEETADDAHNDEKENH